MSDETTRAAERLRTDDYYYRDGDDNKERFSYSAQKADILAVIAENERLRGELSEARSLLEVAMCDVVPPAAGRVLSIQQATGKGDRDNV